jgi:SH3-like domain-containing protein
VRFAILLMALSLYVGSALFAAVGVAPAYSQSRADGKTITRCDVKAYVIDRDPHGMNVRAGPGSTHKVIGNLPNQDVEGIRVHITGAQGDWVRIDLAMEEGGEQDRTLFQGEGWLYGPLLGVDGVGGIEGGTKLYQEPTERSRVLGRLQAGGDGATVQGCRGTWMYVEYKKVKGWAAPGTLCSNPLTTCS